MKKRCTSYIIAYYRRLWLNQSELVQKLGNAYARTYSANSLFMITNITVGIYGFTSEIVDHGFNFTFKEVGLLVNASYCLSLYYIFCVCSHNASVNIASRVQNVLLSIPLKSIDSDTIKEVL